MHARGKAQDVLLCDLCETSPLQSHCELCQINFCKACVGEHLSDSSKRHKVVPYKQKKSIPSYPKCPVHTEKQCELHCEKCDIPVCSTCVTLGNHKGHEISDVMEKIGYKIQSLQKDLEELETRIYPQYMERAFNVQTEKTELERNYRKLTTAADQQGEILHREITAIVNRKKSDIEEMKSKHLATLNKNAEEIAQKITALQQLIAGLKSMLELKDVFSTSSYRSRNSEFRTLPPNVVVTLPSLSPQNINKVQLNEMFGSLSSLSINKEERSYAMRLHVPAALLYPPFKPSPVPRLPAAINTGCHGLRSVSYLSEDQVWICGDNEIMKLLNLQGKLLNSIQTKSGKIPQDIAVTRGGDLVYTDIDKSTVNLVNNIQIQTVITLQGWTPCFICSTVYDDLLVTMISNDETQSRVVRYSGFIEKQTIQFDDQGRPLYSSDYNLKYISENRNLDICVADFMACAVVVVNQLGNLRFRYTGHPTNRNESFHPVGITTDSQSHILTTDRYNECIHIIDHHGQFLRYIRNRDLRAPWGLCVDSRDNLYVAEYDTAKVKKIQYI